MDSSPAIKYRLQPMVDGDLEAIAELQNTYDPESTSGEILRGKLSLWQAGDPRLDIVAQDDDGKVLAYASCLRRKSDPAGKWSVQILVAPPATHAGLGRELHGLLEEFAATRGGTFLSAYVLEKIERGVAFAERAGYACSQHLFDSHLILERYNDAQSNGVVEGLRKDGYRFVTLAEAGDTAENRERIHELDVTSDVDTPGFENWGRRSFEQYSRDEFESFGFSPENVILAEYDGEWVAMHSLRLAPKEGLITTDYTGVLKAHRGRKLAQCLKHLGIMRAKQIGASRIRTSNDERNGPMLAINRKLGFEAEPGFFVFNKEIRGAASQAVAQ